ncbi:hypothetical protein E2C01_024062 [Portunus trituberculatus]|uniref:Uncharacterized protein n=1 Tax=Portunus trituberculatus TaxID=210409 RepID=A0A5B7ECV4_PORTR|nr:hypothetical protein [Portunus trituberculatus]
MTDCQYPKRSGGGRKSNWAELRVETSAGDRPILPEIKGHLTAAPTAVHVFGMVNGRSVQLVVDTGSEKTFASQKTAEMELPQPGPGHGQGDDDSNAESRQSSGSDIEETAVERASSTAMPRWNRRKQWWNEDHVSSLRVVHAGVVSRVLSLTSSTLTRVLGTTVKEDSGLTM